MKNKDELEKEIKTMIEIMSVEIEHGECFSDDDERYRLLMNSTKLNYLIQNLYDYF